MIINCGYSKESNIKNFVNCTYEQACDCKLKYGFNIFCTYTGEKHKTKKEGPIEKTLDQN